MTNAPFALDRREFIALAGGLAAVLVVIVSPTLV